MRSIKQSKGFTLIELVVVIVVIGILAAIAVPKYLDVANEAATAAKQANESAVLSSFAIHLAKNKGAYPTVTALAAGVSGGATATGTGITFTVNGATQTVETYTDANCTSATTAVGDSVQCIKRTA